MQFEFCGDPTSLVGPNCWPQVTWEGEVPPGLHKLVSAMVYWSEPAPITGDSLYIPYLAFAQITPSTNLEPDPVEPAFTVFANTFCPEDVILPDGERVYKKVASYVAPGMPDFNLGVDISDLVKGPLDCSGGSLQVTAMLYAYLPNTMNPAPVLRGDLRLRLILELEGNLTQKVTGTVAFV